MIYLDSAAIVKLVREEPESEDLRMWLAERIGTARATSVISEVEVPRALRRWAPTTMPRIPAVMRVLHRVECDEPVRATAAAIPELHLRSLDAIQLASAVQFGTQLTTFVTYDTRLLASAEAAGLPVASPGA